MSTPQEPSTSLKDIESISIDDAIMMRTAMDECSMTLFSNSLLSNDRPNLLRIDYLNGFLIESFNWFGTEGLSKIFENKEILIPKKGILKIIGHTLNRPRKDELGKPNEPLWPNEARLGKLDYSGTLMVEATITWIEGSGKSGTDNLGIIPLGKIPIMVGSAFCNLTDPSLIKTPEDLVKVGEHCKEYVAFFISNGLEKTLIAQNYLKPDNEIVIPTKLGSSQEVTPCCTIRSKSPDGTMFAHKVFIKISSGNKITHSDRRIYVRIGDWMKVPIYDSSALNVGVNIISVFRIALILIYYMNPFDKDAYVFGRVEQQKAGGQTKSVEQPGGIKIIIENQTYVQSSYEPAINLFNALFNDYAGKELLELATNYIKDTTNEASLEEEESTFWAKTIILDGSAQKTGSMNEKIKPFLTLVGKTFLPHIGTIPFITFKRRLEEARNKYYALPLDINRDQHPVTLEAFKLYNEFKENMLARLKLLAYMAVKIMRVELGVYPLDDRDNLGNQMYEHAGILMNSRFASILKGVENAMANLKEADAGSIVTELTKYGNQIVTSEFSGNFSRGEWNKKGVDKARTGVTDTMPNSVVVARLSYLRRTSSKSGGHSKNTESRELTGLQVGLICPSETPEGKPCGEVEHFALAAFVTNESYDSQTLAFRLADLRTSKRRATNGFTVRDVYNPNTIPIYLNNLMEPTDPNLPSKQIDPDLLISNTRKDNKDTPLFLNNKPIGWVSGLTFRGHLINIRRQGLIHPHTGIHFIQRASTIGMIRQLKIETGGGRIIQPLIISDDPQRTVDMLWSLHLRKKSGHPVNITELIEEGYIEFIDATELEFLNLAPSVSEYLKSIREGISGRYDHIMLNPSFIMGVAANIMPFANNSPVVRNSYFTSMVKHPIDGPLPTHEERAYTSIAKLLTPQIPIVSTEIYDNIFGGNYFGMNVKILITPHKHGEEDGIVVNRRFLDRGGLASVKYNSYSFLVKDDDDLEILQTQPDPDRYGRGTIRVTRKVTRKREDGTIEIHDEPVTVDPQEILAMKTWKVGSEKQYEPLVHDSLRRGTVDRITWSHSDKSSKMLYIVIRMNDDLYVGDKITSRFSQKGVIAAVVDDEDMPFDAETGERADLIINPQSFPSRMTIGMLDEILVANAHIYPDKKKNVYMLYQNRGFDVFAPMERLFLVKRDWKKYKFDEDKVSKPPIPQADGLSDLPTDSSGMLLPDDPFKSSQSYPEKIPADVIVVSSEEVNNQNDMNALKAMDIIQDDESWRSLWAIRIYSEGYRSSHPIDTVSVKKDIPFAGSNPKYMIVAISDPSPDQQIEIVPNTNPVVEDLLSKSNELRDMVLFVLKVPADKIHEIPGIFFDTELGPSGQRVNPMRGIKLSDFSTQPIDVPSGFNHLGNSLQQIYLRGNGNLPVPTQYIAGYLDKFFIAANIDSQFYDFYIPDNMRTIRGIQGFEENQDMTLVAGIKYSDLKKEKTPIKFKRWTVKVDENGEILRDENGKTYPIEEIIETTLLTAWTDNYSKSLLIPKENVINLPDDAKDIFLRREEKIASLRKATIFKENMDINDAMKELELMGYSPDMKSKFINGKTGKPMEGGGIVSGWSYYFLQPHKVNYKMQARGFGKRDPRTMQPNQGRSRGGGLRFNFADALAVIKSGAVNVVADRLLDSSSRQDVFVCTKCDEICYKIGPKGSAPGSIVCPLCTTETTAIKVSVPYVFMLQRNLLMGAGVRYKIKARLEDEDEDEF